MSTYALGVTGIVLLLSLYVIGIWMAWPDPKTNSPTKEPRQMSKMIMIPLMLAQNFAVEKVSRNHIIIDGSTYRFDHFTSIDGNGKIVLALVKED